MAEKSGWNSIILIVIIVILMVSASEIAGFDILGLRVKSSDDGNSSPIIMTHPLARTVTIGESVMSDQATLNVRTPLTAILDDFSAPTLNTSLWTIIDPIGDTTFTMVDTDNPDASLEITIPAGTAHDVWGGGNFAPHIMQTLNNSDFEIEAKFQSQMTSQYQMQGMIIQQDNENYLRFDIYKDMATTRVFAASFTGGIPAIVYDAAISPGSSLYLRINRNGDEWNQFYSYDGTTWTAAANFKYPLNVSSAGLFAGTAGDNPAFTCQIDYFSVSVFPGATEYSTPANSIFNISGFMIHAIEGTGIQNWNVIIKNSTMERKQVTDANGFFEFTDLLNGTYTVTEELRPGWKNTTEASQKILVSGQNITNLNFINTILPKNSGIVSDDFSGLSLNTSLWTKIDPQKDSTFTIKSEGTSNSLLSIFIPANTSHDVWAGNNASRIMQSVNNMDFEVEVKFQSLLNMKYQMQGIIVEQDRKNFIRFDFYSDDGKIWIFAADFIDGSPSMKINKIIGDVPGNDIPLYMRVKRTESRWDQTYSYDGANWNDSVSFYRKLTMTSVGPFAANAGSNPALTVMVDYFVNTSSPVDLENLE